MKSIRRELHYTHPPERVWRVLTDPAIVATWLMEPEGFEPRAGCRFRFRTKPAPGFDGVIHCEVIEANPPRRLSYSWASSKNLEHPTLVSWTLEAASDGTRLLFEHSGFRGLSGLVLRSMLRNGWGKKLTRYMPEVLNRLAVDSSDAELLRSSVMDCDRPS